MTIYLKKDTASQEIPLGMFLCSSDGTTPKTGLSIASTDIYLWKNGAVSYVNKNSGGASEISGGRYYATLDATDTNTAGPLVVDMNPSGALYHRLELMVLPALVYDSLVGGTDNLQVDTIQLSGTTQAARDIGTSVLVGDKTGFALTAAYDAAKTAANSTDVLAIAEIKRLIAGYVLTASSYNASNKLLAATIATSSTTYTVSITYDGSGNLSTYTVV